MNKSNTQYGDNNLQQGERPEVPALPDIEAPYTQYLGADWQPVDDPADAVYVKRVFPNGAVDFGQVVEA